METNVFTFFMLISASSPTYIKAVFSHCLVVKIKCKCLSPDIHVEQEITGGFYDTGIYNQDCCELIQNPEYQDLKYDFYPLCIKKVFFRVEFKVKY